MHFQIAREGRRLSVMKRSFEVKLGLMIILLEDSYLHAVFKVRRFLFSAFSLTFEIVETLRTNIVSWYIEICSKYYTIGKLYTCTAKCKKFSLGNVKSKR